jgi:hypothetical protein
MAMRIATSNLARPRPTGSRASALLDHIEAIPADVWVLTETHLRFPPSAGYRMIAASMVAPDRTPDERWTAIWVREEIEAVPVCSRDAERTACARLLAPDGQAVYVYGTVLPWLSDRRRSPRTGAAAFAAALAEQALDWQKIRSSEPHAGFYVAGDLNQALRIEGHYYGSEAGRTALRAALAEAGLRCLTGTTRIPSRGSAEGAPASTTCASRGCRWLAPKGRSRRGRRPSTSGTGCRTITESWST